MSIFKKLEMRETGLGALLNKNKIDFEHLFKLMSESKPARVFFLSSLEEIRRKEEPPAPTLEELQEILMGEVGIPSSKAEKVAKEIAARVSVRIAERRAVSTRLGSFGLIDPFDESKRVPKVTVPFISHIYGSYFSNFFATLEVLAQLYPVKPKEIGEIFQNGDGKIGSFTETLSLCEECEEISSREKERCKHDKIHLNLFKLKGTILEAWEKGAILCGYLAHVFREDSWHTYAEQEIRGTNDVFHQVDVIAEKQDRVLIFECKQYSPSVQVSKDEVMKALGVMGDLENTINGMVHGKKDIKKVIATTSAFHKEITGINKRKDVCFINKDMLLEEPGWVWEI